MKIHVLSAPPTEQQLIDMLEQLKTVIKLAVDVERGVVAGGGEWHADCEKVLLESGSKQEDVWGADWSPNKKQVAFEAMLNIRPRQNNRSMVIQDPELRIRVERIVRSVFEGTQK